MGFLSSIAGFLAKPIVGTIGSIATGLLGQKGANDQIGRASCRERVYVLV